MSEKKRAAVLAHEAFGELEGKTGNGLVLYSEESQYEISVIIDRENSGEDAGVLLGLEEKGIPIVSSFEEALSFELDVLIMGSAPPGGRIPPAWRETIVNAFKNGLDVVSGLHEFFSDDPEFSALAEENGAKIMDLRKPPKELRVAQGEVREIDTPVVPVLATDAATGKRVTAIELVKEARRRDYDLGFVATGQTGMLLGADAGECIDAIPTDFASGEVEKLVMEVDKEEKDIIFVEGQGSLSHPAYGPISLGILSGTWPQALILAHDPFRESRDGFPQFGVPEPEEEIELIKSFCPETEVVGISVNGEVYTEIVEKTDDEMRAVAKELEEKTGLPAVNVLRFGAEKLFDALEEYLGI